jgi:hypothetical protein
LIQSCDLDSLEIRIIFSAKYIVFFLSIVLFYLPLAFPGCAA